MAHRYLPPGQFTQLGQSGHTASVGATAANCQSTDVGGNLASNVSFRTTRTRTPAP